jgi:hypothetical protein
MSKLDDRFAELVRAKHQPRFGRAALQCMYICMYIHGAKVMTLLKEYCWKSASPIAEGVSVLNLL